MERLEGDEEVSNRHHLLDLAKQATTERPTTYGAPEDNFQRIAWLWTAYIRSRFGIVVEFAPADIALMCDLIKTARLAHDPTHLDSWVDKAGYSACGAEVAECKFPDC